MAQIYIKGYSVMNFQKQNWRVCLCVYHHSHVTTPEPKKQKGQENQTEQKRVDSCMAHIKKFNHDFPLYFMN